MVIKRENYYVILRFICLKLFEENVLIFLKKGFNVLILCVIFFDFFYFCLVIKLFL